MHVTNDLIAAITDATGDGFCLCEMITDEAGAPVDYRFLVVNEFFEDYTGLANATGRTALELVPGLEQHWIDTYARVGLGREKLRFESGSETMGRWFEVFASPVEPHGQLTIFFRDITERRQAELARERATEHAQRLLDELCHRVKNSLNVISSIIGLEARALPPDAQEVLGRLRARIGAVAELYTAMEDVSTDECVPMQPYLSKVIAGLEGALLGQEVTVRPCLSPLALDSRKAVSLGLILNELVTNCAKHAFAGGQAGTITVTLDQDGPAGRLVVEDDGVGPEAGDTGGSGLGAQLVQAFVTDLGGTQTRHATDCGTKVEIVFPAS